MTQQVSSSHMSLERIDAEDSQLLDSASDIGSPRSKANCSSDHESSNNSTTGSHICSSNSSSFQDSDSDSEDDDQLPAYWWLMPGVQQESHAYAPPAPYYYSELPSLPKNYGMPAIYRRKLSCLLSKILRHAGSSWGLHISADGFISVSELLNIPAFWQDGISQEDVQFVVQWEEQQGEKQRFTMRQGMYGPEIRANQGHSQDAVDGQLVTQPADVSELPEQVLHGTFCRNLTSILSEGLKPMRRHHVHMFVEETCVGRKDAEVLIYIDVAKSHTVGVEFLTSDNGVVLSAGRIPPACFTKIVRVEDNAVLEHCGDYAKFVAPASASVQEPNRSKTSSRQSHTSNKCAQKQENKSDEWTPRSSNKRRPKTARGSWREARW